MLSNPPAWFADALKQAWAQNLEQRAIEETNDWLKLAGEYFPTCGLACVEGDHAANCQITRAALAIATVACLVRSGGQALVAVKEAEISELRTRAEAAERECAAIRTKAQELADRVRRELGDRALELGARVWSDDPADTRCRAAAGAGSIFFRCILTRMHDGEHRFPKFDPVSGAAVA